MMKNEEGMTVTAQQIYDVFIGAMAAFLRGETTALPESMELDDCKALYKLAKRQSLSGALHAATADRDMIAPLKDRLRRDGFLTLAVYEQQQAMIGDIATAFDRDGIDHLFFKGAVVRQYYATPSMRSMGDIDMLIRKKDRADADRAMKALGYECDPASDQVWVYVKDGCMVEMHVFMEQFCAETQTELPYDTVWDDAVLVNGHTYHLTDDAEAAHVLMHLTAHFCAGGCGLRQLMDVAVLCRRFPDEALWERVKARVDARGATTFVGHLLWLCERWFGVAVPASMTVPLDESLQATMKERLLAEGTFGNDERLLLARMRREQKQSHSKVYAVLRWVFPKASYLQHRYWYAAKMPLLVPVAFVHRYIDAVTKNRRTHQKRIDYVRENEEKLQAELALFEKLGL
ncbi:MAG: nucleotidyltransferase family protein [Clostridia bacterium]|nr:nucleotidyltransferase family protein [Clostridia bacterium]